MKNKFLIILTLFSLVILKTTAQNTFVNTSPKEIKSDINPFSNLNYANPQILTSGLIFELKSPCNINKNNGSRECPLKYK